MFAIFQPGHRVGNQRPLADFQSPETKEPEVSEVKELVWGVLQHVQSVIHQSKIHFSFTHNGSVVTPYPVLQKCPCFVCVCVCVLHVYHQPHV